MIMELGCTLWLGYLCMQFNVYFRTVINDDYVHIILYSPALLVY